MWKDEWDKESSDCSAFITFVFFYNISQSCPSVNSQNVYKNKS